MALAETVVDVVANTDPFERDFERTMQAAGRRAGRSIDRGIRNETRDTGRTAGQRIGRDIGQNAQSAMRRGIRGGGGGGGGFARAGRRAGDAWSRGFERAARRRRFRAAGNILKWLGIGAGLMAAIPAAVSGIGALTTAFGAAAGAAVAFSSALAPLAGIFSGLPAAIAGTAAAAGTLAVAFRGIEDAAEAALTGTGQEFREAIEDLAPAAQSAMRELRGMRNVFDQLQSSVQGAFFSQILGDLEALEQVISGPLQRGMTGLSREFGRVASTILEFGRSAEAASAIEAIFFNLQRATRAASSGLEPALTGIANAIVALAPQIQELGKAVGDMLAEWGRGLSDRAQSGQLARDFERAVSVARQLGRIASNLLDTVMAVGRAINRAFGGDILSEFEQATQALRGWSMSDAGQSGITGLFADLRRAAASLAPVFSQLGRSVVQLVSALADAAGRSSGGLQAIIAGLGDGLSALARGAGEFIRAAGPELGNVLRELGRALGELLAGAGPGFARGFESLGEALTNFNWRRIGRDLGSVFAVLAQVIEDLSPLIDRLLQIVGDVTTILDRITAASDRAVRLNEDQGFSEIAIGEGMLNFQRWLNQAQVRAQEMFGQLGQGITQAIEGLGPLVQVGIARARQFFIGLGQGILANLQQLWSFLQPILSGIGQFFVGLGQGFVTQVQRLWTFLGPILGAVGRFFTGFGSGIIVQAARLWNWLAPILGRVGQFFLGLGQGLFNAAQRLWNFLGPILGAVGRFFTGFGSGLIVQAARLWNWLQPILSNVGQFFVGLGQGIVNQVQRLWNWLDSIVSSVANFFSQLGSRIAGAARNALGGLSALGKSGALPFPLPFADGGMVNRPTNALVGEAGPEVIIPLSQPRRAQHLAERSGLADMLASATGGGSPPRAGGRSHRAGATTAAGHPTTTVNAPITVTTAATDPDIVAGRIAHRLQRHVRGAVA